MVNAAELLVMAPSSTMKIGQEPDAPSDYESLEADLLALSYNSHQMENSNGQGEEEEDALDLLVQLAEEAELPYNIAEPKTKSVVLNEPHREYHRVATKDDQAHSSSLSSSASETPGAKIFGISRSHNNSVRSLGGNVPSQSLPSPESTDNTISMEEYSGLRVKQRVIQAAEMNRNMTGRTMYKLSKLPRLNSASLNDDKVDWVSVGIVVRKSDPKTSSNGGRYAVWNMTDLRGTSITLLLFGEAYSTHSQERVGAMIAFINPRALNNDGKSTAFSVTSQTQIAKIGMAADFAFCRANTNAGKSCPNVVDKEKTEYCDHHIAKQFKQMRVKRPEFGSDKLLNTKHITSFRSVPASGPPTAFNGRGQVPFSRRQSASLQSSSAQEIAQHRRVLNEYERERDWPKGGDVSEVIERIGGKAGGVPSLGERGRRLKMIMQNTSDSSTSSSSSTLFGKPSQGLPSQKLSPASALALPTSQPPERADPIKFMQTIAKHNKEGASKELLMSGKNGLTGASTKSNPTVDSRGKPPQLGKHSGSRDITVMRNSERKPSKPTVPPSTLTQTSTLSTSGQNATLSSAPVSSKRPSSTSSAVGSFPPSSSSKLKPNATRTPTPPTQIPQVAPPKELPRVFHQGQRQSKSSSPSINITPRGTEFPHVQPSPLPRHVSSSAEHPKSLLTSPSPAVVHRGGGLDTHSLALSLQTNTIGPQGKGVKRPFASITGGGSAQTRAPLSSPPTTTASAGAVSRPLPVPFSRGNLPPTSQTLTKEHEDPLGEILRSGPPAAKRGSDQSDGKGLRRAQTEGKSQKSLSATTVNRAATQERFDGSVKVPQASSVFERLAAGMAPAGLARGMPLKDRSLDDIVEKSQMHESAYERQKKISSYLTARGSSTASALGTSCSATASARLAATLPRQNVLLPAQQPSQQKSSLADIFRGSEIEAKAMAEEKTKVLFEEDVIEELYENSKNFLNRLEAKDAMAQRMTDIKSMKVRAFTCSECNYTKEKALQTCTTAGHRPTRVEAIKRFFECSQCRKRTTTLDSLLPSWACDKCTNATWKRAGMYREQSSKKGADADTMFRARGVEHARFL